jgi:hypothetical protein
MPKRILFFYPPEKARKCTEILYSKTLKTPALQGFSVNCGGEAGIRTLARLATSNDLANRPLRPAWVLLHIKSRKLEVRFKHSHF